ncbi:hypothetical protein [Clostridium estertheticum]|uniref:hypothetical protein n=1 Tax=Clostridium estertheticum TaxID=238834 RepID=UPI001C7CD56A|nr:hypothetical protein [Clostridium estertheticum]MBX4265463.1 hypothetical protein [Clostridium estertheticum]WLC90186.1 hypothetical protein KTC95_08385 [Clostridium estertheticum]
MNIFKLFYAPKKIPQFDVNYFCGSTSKVFGIEIEPENYTEFMNEYFKTFSRNNVQQNIMTNYKFEKFIEQRSKLGLEILNIHFMEKEELVLSKNENYNDMLSCLNKRNVKEAKCYIEELIEDGFNISTIECISKDDNQYRINVHNNGTISFNYGIDNIKKYIKDKHIVDYLCTGIIN